MVERLDWQAALRRLEGAYSERTLHGYGADIRVYTRWCAQAGHAPFGEDPEAVVQFVEIGMADRAPATIRRRLVALRKLYRLLGLHDPLDDEGVKLAVRRALRRNGRRSAQALGLGASLRDRLIGACPETLKGLRDRALIAVGYDVLARRSELVGLQCEDLVRLERGAKILIRQAKTDPYRQGRFAYLSVGGVAHLQAWLEAAQIRSGPLFRPMVNGWPQPRPLHACGVNRALKEAAQRAGVSAEAIRQLSGHSMRVGAAQDLVIAGRSVLQIMTAGRWTSTNVLGAYVRAADLNLWEDER